jgi:hypothetical protein
MTIIMNNNTTYNPIIPIFYEILEDEQQNDFNKVFYFGEGSNVEEAKGRITGVKTRETYEEYLVFDSGEEVRLDRIITINGKPGPAFDEYDAYALACLNCNVPEP